jgi:2-polyprenyl-6-methoxyphenol hydroxylase-like FAD-dependent oxidoreductase
MTNTELAIIGGGIAGTVTAMAARRAGLNPTVYEAYDETADGVGAFLSLAPNGIAALRELDLHTLVRDVGFETPRMELSMSGGRKLASFSLGGSESEGTTAKTVRRAALYTALREEAVRRGVTVEYGKRLADASTGQDGIRVSFADGSTATGDVLVGADGLRSTLRRIIDPAAPAPRYVPLLNTGGYARGIDVPGEPGVLYMIFGKRCFFCYAKHPDGEIWWFANPPQQTEPDPRDLAAMTSEKWRARLTELFAGDRLPALEIIEATAELLSGWSTYDFPSVPTWHRGRMVVIGDAAHAVSPASGQGASQAIEDAVVLAKCLRDAPGVEAAFAAYERIRRERVERVVVQGKKNGSQKALGPMGRLLLPAVFRLGIAGRDDQSWMLDHRIRWDEPVAA